MNYIELLEECIKVAKERQSQYGHATPSILSAVDLLDINFDLELTPKQFCQVMIAGKMAREKYKHKKDNIIDIINYLAIMETL